MDAHTPEPSYPRAVPDPPADEALRVVEAARVLGVSEKRVRQFVDDGRLVAVNPEGGPLRVSRSSVVELKRDREAAAKLGANPPGAGRHAGQAEQLTPAQILERLEGLVNALGEQHTRQLETAEAASKRAEQAHVDALAEARHRAQALEVEARELRDQLARSETERAAAKAEAAAVKQMMDEARQRRRRWGRS